MNTYNKQDLEDALKECYTYNRMGGLNRSMIKDFAKDYNVPYEIILEELGWEE